jgi:ankyrin repeat protein
MSRLLAVLALALGAMGPAAASELHDAASSGDLAAVERLLDQGAGVDARGQNAETPLMAAALAGQREVAEALLAQGADVQARNAGGFTPLHAAAYAGSLPVAALLLDHGAKLEDNQNKAGVTPLLVAAEENHPRLVELLIARGSSIATPERHGYLPLTRAFWKGNVEVIQVLKRHGATCQAADILGGEAAYQQCVAAAN